MQALSRLKRLFSPVAGWVGLTLLAVYVCHGQSLSTDLSKDLSHSAFSTTSILADLTNGNQRDTTIGVAPLSTSGTLVSSQPGAFRYNPENRQTTSVHKLAEEIRATQQLEKARNAEITEHPFWYAKFWTHSPVVLLGIITGGGDHHALETPLSQFEKLSATSYMDTNYNSEAELKKFEQSVGFGNSNPAGDK